MIGKGETESTINHDSKNSVPSGGGGEGWTKALVVQRGRGEGFLPGKVVRSKMEANFPAGANYALP